MNHEDRKVTFVFSSQRIGGAERSMLRWLRYLDMREFTPSAIFVSGSNPPVEQELSYLGIEYTVTDLFGTSKFLRALKRYSPDVLYVFGTFRTLPLIMAAKQLSIPRIIAAERGSATRPTNILCRLVDRYLFDAYITNSKTAAVNLNRLCGIPKDRVSTAYNGIIIPPRPNPRLCKPIQNILSVGNLRPLKGHKFLVQAVAALRGEFPSLHVTIAGKDLTNGEFPQWIYDNEYQDFVELIGFVPEEKIVDLMDRSDILVHPTSTREGLPTAILEAMANRLPVIATSVGGIPELVLNEQTGLLVEPGSSKSIYDAIYRYICNPDFAASLASRALESVTQTRTFEAMTESHLQVFFPT